MSPASELGFQPPYLRCPETGQTLSIESGGDLVTDDGAKRYPVIDGVPILLAESNLLFSKIGASEPWARKSGPLLSRLVYSLPTGSRNVGSSDRFQKLLATITARKPPHGSHRVLIIGGGVLGDGLDSLLSDPRLQVIETDISIGPRTSLVCDAHSLPFADGSFDAVVCQAVLEHVVEPTRVVSEIHRVLMPEGIVYTEVPFMQQVHGGPYDFTRYSMLGHRRLLRDFEEIDSGAMCGPGMSLSWSFRYFVMSFAGDSRRLRGALGAIAGLLTSWLVLFDSRLVRSPGGLDAASGTYFVGRRSEHTLPDNRLVDDYRGACPVPGSN